MKKKGSKSTFSDGLIELGLGEDYIELLSKSTKDLELLVNQEDCGTRFLKESLLSEQKFLMATTFFTSIGLFESFLLKEKDHSNLFYLEILKDIYGDNLLWFHSRRKKKTIQFLLDAELDPDVIKAKVSKNKLLRILSCDPAWADEKPLKKIYTNLIKKLGDKSYGYLKRDFKLKEFAFFSGFIRNRGDRTQKQHSYNLYFSGLFPNCNSPRSLENTYLERKPEKFISNSKNPRKLESLHLDFIQKRYLDASNSIMNRNIEKAMNLELNGKYLSELHTQNELQTDKVLFEKHNKPRKYQTNQEKKDLKKLSSEIFNSK